jgi:RimJ/RimL family protein N-acetyltransferase
VSSKISTRCKINIIKVKRIKLRALTSSDIEKTLSWHSQEEISDLYLGHPFPVNLELEKQWYDKILASNLPLTVFGIENLEDQTLIGISTLKDINLINRTAEFSVYIGDKNYKGRGLSKEATMATLSFGFAKLGLNRIFLKVIEDNEIAVNLYKSVGFKVEGLLQRSIFKNGRFKNELLMAILLDEFRG